MPAGNTNKISHIILVCLMSSLFNGNAAHLEIIPFQFLFSISIFHIQRCKCHSLLKFAFLKKWKIISATTFLKFLTGTKLSKLAHLCQDMLGPDLDLHSVNWKNKIPFFFSFCISYRNTSGRISCS